MPPPPPQSNGDAEFIAKKWVWVPDESEGYVKGWITKELGDDQRNVALESGQLVTVPLAVLSDMNPPRFDKAADIADLTYLNEASVVHNLRIRYTSDLIYTYSSIFLVAINPYHSLDIYSPAHIEKYRNRRREENPPHIFAIAERAWVNMREGRESQSVLITGESGAGKTENTKKVIQYLAAIAADALPASSAAANIKLPPALQRTASTRSAIRPPANGAAQGIRGILERQILEANPILEAFGNAQTMRNNNSSRFGKFVRIFFSQSGAIAGANVNWYLLEKSRVVYRSAGERNFHAFYMLLAACQENTPAGRALREELLLDGEASDYDYLNKSALTIEGVDDLAEWRLFKDALNTVGFSPDREQMDLLRVLAAILLLGNIEISGDRSNQAQIHSRPQVERACYLLGLPPAEFTKSVLSPKVKAGRETVIQARTKQQAVDELASLCKTMYEKTFGSVVQMINRALDRPKDAGTFIGVLDIAGFEIFEVNSFEQLCINYTNEKLQQFFNHHMFVLEQQEYAREEIEWDYVDFGHDLQQTIELIEGSARAPIGILSCLDEECIMPKASDTTFLDKLNNLWKPSGGDSRSGPAWGSSKYGTIRFNAGFTVQHYAGKVEYRTDGWLDKNKDPLNSHITSVLAGSTNGFVAGLFAEYADQAVSESAYGRRVKTGAFRTVAQRHQEELTKLMLQLDATEPHFVRCIVPNRFKQPGKIDVPLVLDQLRCNGVLEGIRIARRGYPNRIPFAEFRQRYGILTPDAFGRGYIDGREACQSMIVALELDRETVKLGTTKVFFKVGVLADLQERLDAHLYDLVSRFQAAVRRFTARRQLLKILNRDAAVRTIQRNARVYNDLRQWPWWQLFNTVVPLLAATRSNQEMQRKNAELLFAQERAERDEQEKAALEALRVQLESDKRDIELNLEAERVSRLNQAEVHEQTVRRCREEILELQGDMDVLAVELEKAMAAKTTAEAQMAHHKAEYDELAGEVENLDQQREQLQRRETSLLADVKARTESAQRLETERDQLLSSIGELQRKLQASEEDLARAKSKVAALEKDLQGKLESDAQQRSTESSKIAALEKESAVAKERLAELVRTVSDSESRLQKKDADISRLQADVESSTAERRAVEQAKAQLDVQVQNHLHDLDVQRDIADRETEARTALEAQIDELRTTMGSEETRRSEADRSKAEEIASLRSAVTRLEGDIAKAGREASEATGKLTLDLETAKREHASLTKNHGELEMRAQDQAKSLAELECKLSEAEGARRGAEEELQGVRSRLVETNAVLAETNKAKEGLERQLSKSQKMNQDYEEAIIAIERDKGSWAAQMAELQRRLDAENKQRLKLEDLKIRTDSELGSLQDRLSRTERELLKVGTDFDALDAECRLLRSRENKTIIEHVHVLEAAKRLTDRQLADSKLELDSLRVYVRSLEKAKAGDAETLSRQGERERKAIREAEERARLKLLRELQSGNENLASGISSQARSLMGAGGGTLSSVYVNGKVTDRTADELANARREISDLKLDRSKLQSELSTLRLRAEDRRTSSNHKSSSSLGTSESAQLQRTIDEMKSKYDKCFCDLQVAEEEKLKAQNLVLSREQELRELRDEDNERQARLEEELGEYHSKIIAERGFDYDLKKERYHGALALSTSENAAHIKKITELREEIRGLKADKQGLQFQLDDEIHGGSSWKEERKRFETGLVDLREAKQSAEASLEQARAEAVQTMSQLRELRNALDERDGAVHTNANKTAVAFEKQKMAETALAEAQAEAARVREEVAVVERRNAQLEKQLRDANIRVIDYETTPLSGNASLPPPSSPSKTTPTRSRSSFLFHTPSSPGSSSSLYGTPGGRSTAPANAEILERRYESLRRSKEESERRLEELRELVRTQQRTETDLTIAKRKAEREAVDQRVVATNRLREIEQLKEQLHRAEARFFQATTTSTGARS